VGKRWFVILVWMLWVVPVLASLEDPGPYAVGWRDVVFTDANFGRGQVRGRIYYPALTLGTDTAPNPAAGPYPLTAFQHGYLESPEDYDSLNIHTASWGFVVASIGTETSLRATMQEEARDTRALLHWVNDEGDDPSSFLYQMSREGDWGATGHSMGGGSLMYLISYEPRVRTIIPLQSYRGPLLGGSSGGSQNLKNFTGSVFFVAGSVDFVVPADLVYAYFTEADTSRRNFYTLVQGMGHVGPTDFPPTNEPLPAADQLRLHRRFVTGFLRAELLGQQNLYAELLGEGTQDEPVQQQSASLEPALWVAPSKFKPGALVVGLAGAGGEQSVLGFSEATAQIPTPLGTLGLDPSQGGLLAKTVLTDAGITESLFTTDYPSGTSLYFQGAARATNSGSVTRVEGTVVP